MTAKWRNCELKDPKKINAVRSYCNEHKIPYETSGAGDYTHFEIFCTTEIAFALNAIIDGKADYHPKRSKEN